MVIYGNLFYLFIVQNNLESVKGSGFDFDYVWLLYYKCCKINPNRGGSHLYSPDWIKTKKGTINAFNKKGSKCFQYVVAVGLTVTVH